MLLRHGDIWIFQVSTSALLLGVEEELIASYVNFHS